MPLIKLTTTINAPIERCFDLSRSIDLHTLSTSQTSEKAIAGVTKGLIGLNEQVTWRARHFGLYQNMTTVIPAFSPPYYFESKMLKGAFKQIEHRHIFKPEGENTIMEDEFYFEAPLGVLGELVCKLILTEYMTTLLKQRNACIKRVAESDEWKKLLDE